jgi:integrase
MPRGAAVIQYDGKRVGRVWRIQFVDADGKHVTETIGAERDGVTRKQAEAELRERLVRVEKRGWRRPAPLTLGDYARTWFDEGKKRRHWKPSTVTAYRRALVRLGVGFDGVRDDRLASARLASIRPRDVAGYVQTALEKFSAKTIDLDLSVLHDVLKTARREELIDSNAAEGAERPKAERKHWRILQPAEVQRVGRAFTDERARLAFLTLMLTGIRRFELQGLRWRDVDLIANVLRVTKSKTEEGERSIAISPTLAELLWQHRRASKFKGDDEFVFAHPKRGSKLDQDWYADEFRAALKAAGITDYVRPFHDARHASLTNGAATGERPLELMTRAGHRSMATTQQYIHLAGVTFPDAALALETRLLGGGTFHPTETTSADLTASDPAEQAENVPARPR